MSKDKEVMYIIKRSIPVREICLALTPQIQPLTNPIAFFLAIGNWRLATADRLPIHSIFFHCRDHRLKVLELRIVRHAPGGENISSPRSAILNQLTAALFYI
jgi:hypothetical protein